MAELLLEPFSGGLMQRALIAAVLVGAACGAVGVWALIGRQAYATESLAHAMLPGVVGATLIGAPLLAGAGAGLLAAAGAVWLAARDSRIGPDVAIGVTVTSLFGAGALLALVPASPPRLGELLFGDPLGISPSDLAAAGGLALTVLAALAVLRRRFVAAAFDPVSAATLGAPPAAARLAETVLLAATIGAGVQALGSLLVVALLIAPAATALRLSHGIGAALVLAAAIGALSGYAGLVASDGLGIAAGAAIALAALAVFALSLAAPGRGAGPVAALRRSPAEAAAPPG